MLRLGASSPRLNGDEAVGSPGGRLGLERFVARGQGPRCVRLRQQRPSGNEVVDGRGRLCLEILVA